MAFSASANQGPSLTADVLRKMIGDMPGIDPYERVLYELADQGDSKDADLWLLEAMPLGKVLTLDRHQADQFNFATSPKEKRFLVCCHPASWAEIRQHANDLRAQTGF